MDAKDFALLMGRGAATVDPRLLYARRAAGLAAKNESDGNGDDSITALLKKEFTVAGYKIKYWQALAAVLVLAFIRRRK